MSQALTVSRLSHVASGTRRHPSWLSGDLT